MGLLSKLFGNDKDVENAAKDLLSGIFGAAADAARDPDKKAETSSDQDSSFSPEPAPEPDYSNEPSGDSWGPVMPDEPNQYNYSGNFEQYFDDIFSTEFSEYRLEKQRFQDGKLRIVYSFYGSSGKALVVELMPSSSSAKKAREDCRKAGTPYLRYYYNHDGWWNTRSYVTQRTRRALQG